MGITTNFTVSGQQGITSWLTGGASIMTGESDSWIIGTTVEYSIYVEFGTSSQKAQPYLFPAAKRVIAESRMYWERSEDLNDFIKKLAFAIERRAKHRCPVDTGNLMNSIEAERL